MEYDGWLKNRNDAIRVQKLLREEGIKTVRIGEYGIYRVMELVEEEGIYSVGECLRCMGHEIRKRG